jgi:hypothetical protein
MNIKKGWQLVGAIAGVVLALGVGFAVFLGRVSAPTQPVAQVPQAGMVSLTIGGLYENKQVSVSLDETVLQVLQKLDAQDPNLRLSIKEYVGMGALVEGMHGIKNGTDKKYWQYKVNGVMPQVGAGALPLKNGDSIEWFFASSQE